MKKEKKAVKEKKAKEKKIRRKKPVKAEKKKVEEKKDIWSKEAVEEKKTERKEKNKKETKIEERVSVEEAEKLFKERPLIVHPQVSEKSVGAIEKQNKISFIVSKNATKKDLKKAVEDLYQVKVKSIKTLNDSKGRKKAVVALKKEFKAQDLATKLGIV